MDHPMQDMTSSASEAEGMETTEMAPKYPLMSQWTMWFDQPVGKSRTSDWGASLKKIMDFDFVEDFWGMFNNICAVSKLPVGGNYHMFKAGIEPKWEDPQNKHGGKWVFTIPRKGIPSFTETIDDLWLSGVLACIGEQFDEYSDQVCGIVASPRAKGDRIALWLRSCSPDHIRPIGTRLKAILHLPDAVKIQFLSHSEAAESSKYGSAVMEL